MDNSIALEFLKRHQEDFKAAFTARLVDPKIISVCDPAYEIWGKMAFNELMIAFLESETPSSPEFYKLAPFLRGKIKDREKNFPAAVAGSVFEFILNRLETASGLK
jgi:hypothetical protein